MIGTVSFTIEADPEDKKELFNILSEKGVGVRYFARDARGISDWIILASSVLVGLIELYKFLKGKEDKKVDIKIRKRNGEIISVNSKNAEDLKIYIDQLSNRKNGTK